MQRWGFAWRGTQESSPLGSCRTRSNGEDSCGPRCWWDEPPVEMQPLHPGCDSPWGVSRLLLCCPLGLLGIPYRTHPVRLCCPRWNFPSLAAFLVTRTFLFVRGRSPARLRLSHHEHREWIAENVMTFDDFYKNVTNSSRYIHKKVRPLPEYQSYEMARLSHAWKYVQSFLMMQLYFHAWVQRDISCSGTGCFTRGHYWL